MPKEESGMVSDLRYGWKKLRKLGTEVSDNLARLQVCVSVCDDCGSNCAQALCMHHLAHDNLAAVVHHCS